MDLFKQLFSNQPLVAILRGVEHQQVVAISQAIIEQGIGILEVPMNSPEPLKSIKAMVEALEGKAVCGGGTVLTVEQVEQIHAVGGQLIVSPNCDPAVIKRAIELNMIVMPGVATPTEAFTATHAGAKIIKLFPAAGIGEISLKNMLAVLPESITLLAVGGINPDNMNAFWQAGARGFGIGSDIYKPGDSVSEVALKTAAVVSAYKKIKGE